MKKWYRRKWIILSSVASLALFLLPVALRQKPSRSPATVVAPSTLLYLIRNPGCRIPDLNPDDHAYTRATQIPKCKNSLPLTYVQGDRLILNDTARREVQEKYGGGKINCCFRYIYRDEEGTSDDLFRYSDKCIPIANVSVKLSSSFLRVSCTHHNKYLYSNFHVAILKTLAIEDRCRLLQKASRGSTRKSRRTKKRSVSVLVLGVDTMSRLNFHRFMPETKRVLLSSHLEATEMLGYNKVKDNTFPNVIPMLTGLSDSQLKSACWKDQSFSFDGCQFVWHQFLDKGYRTLMAEDAPHLGTFNYFRKGFFWPPADYYLRPLMLAAQASMPRQGNICVGSKLEVQVVLDWLLDFARTFAGKEYFAFSWLTSLIHDLPENAKVADQFFAQLFSTFVAEDLLKDTVLIFLSDHGPRWGDFRETVTGWYEEKLPMLFIAVPPWIRKAYPLLVDNLKQNSKRLVTPFDIHETLMDILHLDEASKGKITPRMYSEFPVQGISLFRSIPENRTCEDALIEPHFCACNEISAVESCDEVIEVGEFVVSTLNALIQERTDRCVPLAVSKILYARVVKGSNKELTYVITLRVGPSNAILEATVTSSGKKGWHLGGEVSRITAYDGQADCVNDPILRKYCYCDRFKF